MAQLPVLTLAAGGRIAIITQGHTPFDARASVRLGGDVVKLSWTLCSGARSRLEGQT